VASETASGQNYLCAPETSRLTRAYVEAFVVGGGMHSGWTACWCAYSCIRYSCWHLLFNAAV